MDIEKCREAFKRGENVAFPISIGNLYFFFFVLLVFAIYSGHLLLSSFSSGIEDWRKIIIIVASPFFCYATLRLGKCLFVKQKPQLFSVNKDYLLIYDKTISSLFNNKNSHIIIPWEEILGLEIKKVIEESGHKRTYLAFKCKSSTIKNIQEHQEQISVKLFRSYGIVEGVLMLNTKTWLDMPIEDVLDLLQEFHKEATSQKQ